MTIETSPQPVSMLSYALKLTGISALLSILAMVIAEVLKFELPSAMGIITLVAATSFVTQGFVTKNGRVMSKGERMSFATLGSVFSLLISLVLFAGLLMFSGLELSMASVNAMMGEVETPWALLAGLLALALAISWLVLYFSSGWMCKAAMKRLGKV